MILDDIVEKKKKRLEENMFDFNIEKFYNTIKSTSIPSFYDAIKKDGLSIIGEIKKASPSRGIIKEDFNPEKIAFCYEKCVDAVSVLTENDFFMGCNDYLNMAHKKISLPLLMKDFFISPMQIIEARCIGASAVLLIVSILKEKYILKDYIKLTKGIGMDALVEIHNEYELNTAIEAGADIIGINNRNLNDFSEDINTTLYLSQKVPKEVLIISESAIHTSDDIKTIKSCGVNGVLVGESFMKSENIELKAREFKNAYERQD